MSAILYRWLFISYARIFSIRRRHTRFDCDWSSDVCSSDLMLWHWRILRWITNGFAAVFRRTMGLGGATSLAVSANVFMGMTEAPVLIRPYVKGMTRSELLIMMTAGFATIAGSVLVVYGAFLER